MHGSNRLGGNSLSDLLVFGRRAGIGAADYIASLGDSLPRPADADVDAAAAAALQPFSRTGGENPYALHAELQQMMNDLVGIIRTRAEIEEAVQRLDKIKERAATVSVAGGRAFNPGWHLALDLQNMLLVSECVAKAALLREESRGGHTRDDYPEMSPTWRKVNLICSVDAGGTVQVVQQPLPTMPTELLSLFERSELSKYMTAEELDGLPTTAEAPAGATEGTH
jgi:succinate dehydrogenase / fumarate reductase flavoprotein subunit